jgi:peptidoglycan hydrolase CwlO-like protein
MKNKTVIALIGIVLTIVVAVGSASISYGFLSRTVSANEEKIEDLKTDYRTINEKLDKLAECQTEILSRISSLETKIEMIREELK